MMTDTIPPITEPTPQGQQVLVPGIAPITLADRMAFRVAALILPKRNPDAAQRPCDLGLFDLMASDQCDLIDFLRTAETDTPPTKRKRTKSWNSLISP